ncbi:MAG: Rrf2 family DNA-binding protein, partial [Gemmatimonadetes bacterium]|nr:Rrf2 family DNA-binding protein [Gemmatimonadota bacterium]
DCSIRPVWMLLQQRVDEVLQSVLLSDLLLQESEVRQRVGLTLPAAVASPSGRLALPVLQG